MIENLRWLLLWFKNLSYLKDNFTKNELIPLNITEQKCILYANTLGSKIDILLFN
jgi:hypothetical protein